MKCKKGYKQIGNKCVKGKGFFSKNKLKNPLKVWTSWIGLLIFGFIILFLPILQGNFPDETIDDYSLYQVITYPLSISTIAWVKLISSMIGGMVLGFLIGYGIYYLIKSRR